MSGRSSAAGFGAVAVCLPLALLSLPLLVVVAMSQPASTSVCGPQVGSVVNQAQANQQADAVEGVVAIAHVLGLPERAAVIYEAVRERQGIEGLVGGNMNQQFQQFHPDVQAEPSDQAERDFLGRLVQVPNWETLALADAIQAVTPSDTPQLYAQYEPTAQSAVDAVWNQSTTTTIPVSTGNACAAGNTIGPIVGGQYTLPLSPSWWAEHPEWFAKPHHDYPAADIPVPTGTTVYAATAGTVISAPTGGDCGQGVIIQGDDGARYGYCHGVMPLVPQGVHVSAGEPIMESGSTGDATGPHLHFQIQLPSGAFVCPQSALVAWAQGQAVDVSTLPVTGCFY